MFRPYIDAGLCVVPLRNGTPVEWKEYQERLPNGEILEWEKHKYKEIALVCGRISGVIALDIDTDDPEVIKRVEAIAGVSPVKKRGSKGFTAFYRYNGEKTQRWGTEVEILSDKHLTTLPPSKHRSKNLHYKWEGIELIGAELPLLGKSFYAVMDVLYPKAAVREPTPIHYERSASTERYAERHIELEEARRMLDYISSDCSREEWIKVGMALREEYGDIACNLWHQWSARAATKYNQRDAQSAWRSFNGSGVTIGTLIHKARQNGFEFEVREVQAVVAPPAAAPAPKEKLFNPHVDGLVGEIADWITATSRKPQPILSLSAALAFMGLIKAHRVKGATNLRTNIYCMSLAGSGMGKEYPENAICELLYACGLGRHKLGKPKSGSAIFTGLAKADCRGLLTLSEIGLYVANFLDKRAGSFQREIGHLMIELFNKAGVRYEGDQYANENQNKQVILEEPNLCLFGSSVPEIMQSAITGKEILGGFLNRWIAFYPTTIPVRAPRRDDEPPPEKLIKRILKWIEDNPTNTDNYGKPHPKKMTFTREAFDELLKYQVAMDNKLISIPFPLNQLYVRAAEHAEKIAMVITDGNDIGLPEFAKAVEIVTHSTRTLTEFCRGISDSPHDQMVYKVLDAIKKSGGWISRRDLTRATQWLEPRKRFEILAQLQESEEIEKSEDGKITKYRFIPV